MYRAGLSRVVLLVCLLGAGCLGAPDGPGSSALPPDEGCAAILEDSFDGDAVDGLRWSLWWEGTGSVTLDPPSLRLEIAEDIEPSQSAAMIESTYGRTLGSTRLTARLDVLVAGGQAGLEWADGDDSVAMYVSGGRLWLESVRDGNGAFPCRECVAYDRELHRFWRLRSSAGTIHAEVSADGVAWNEIGRTDTPTGGGWHAGVFVESDDSSEVTALIDAVRWSDCPDA